MDLNCVTEMHRGASLPSWRHGDAWLGGGTWLFSEAQPEVTRLIDLTTLGWPALTLRPTGLEIAATCTIAGLAALECPPHWNASPLIRQCCDAFLASFKIWNVATVGGNVCLALPAGPMISLAVALDGSCTIWAPDGPPRSVPVAEFVIAPRRTSLRPGELVRSIHLPETALTARTAFRQVSLRSLGRSAALVIGRAEPHRLVLTITAATTRPVVIELPPRPDAAQLRAALAEAVEPELYHDDVHGDPDWRQHLTLILAEQIRTELAGREGR